MFTVSSPITNQHLPVQLMIVLINYWMFTEGGQGQALFTSPLLSDLRATLPCVFEMNYFYLELEIIAESQRCEIGGNKNTAS